MARLFLLCFIVACLGIGFLPLSGQPMHPLPPQVNQADVAWILSASGLVLLMTPGLGFFYAGMVTSGNVLSILAQSLAAMIVVSLTWILVGFGIAFGPSFGGLVGDPRSFFLLQGAGIEPHLELGKTIPLILFALFQMKFAIIAPAIIIGAFAERVRFSSYLLFLSAWSIFVYAPLAHWAWSPEGILFKLGVIDFAGGTTVHISAGMAALAGSLFVGRRRVLEHGEHPKPHNIPFVVLGTGLLWFGWFGFNAGSSFAADGIAVLAFINTNTACATAALTWLALEKLGGKQPSTLGLCIGAVVGLVAITPSAGLVSLNASLAIGALGSLASYGALSQKHRWKFDDALDVCACHGVGGVIGMIVAAIFATKGGLINGDTNLLVRHFIGLAIVLPFSFGASLLIFKVVDMIIPLRVSEEEEDQGLDRSQHGEVAEIADLTNYGDLVNHKIRDAFFVDPRALLLDSPVGNTPSIVPLQ
jgi:ammonium transporter, Amt family